MVVIAVAVVVAFATPIMRTMLCSSPRDCGVVVVVVMMVVGPTVVEAAVLLAASAAAFAGSSIRQHGLVKFW